MAVHSTLPELTAITYYAERAQRLPSVCRNQAPLLLLVMTKQREKILNISMILLQGQIQAAMQGRKVD